MQEGKHRWLFPVMVVAAASVIAFGCLGIAAITGRVQFGGPKPSKGIQSPLATQPEETSPGGAIAAGTSTESQPAAASALAGPDDRRLPTRLSR
jgi:hypothetical protein